MKTFEKAKKQAENCGAEKFVVFSYSLYSGETAYSWASELSPLFAYLRTGKFKDSFGCYKNSKIVWTSDK